MMITKKLFTLIAISFLAFTLGCAPHSPAGQSSPTPKYLATAFPDTTSTVNDMPTPISSTKLSTNAEIEMVGLLNANDCVLPCYMGIVPGKTTWNEAKTMLDSLGATSLGESQEDNITNIGYSMQLDDPSIIQANNSVNDKIVFHDMGFVIIENQVQQIRVSVFSSGGISSKIQEYWARFSPDEFFSQVGLPDNVYITDEGGGLAIVYAKQGIVTIFAKKEEKLFCPQIKGRGYALRFNLTNTDYPLDIYPPFENVSKYKSVWFPVEDTLDITTQQFYEKLIDNPSICFEIKR